LGAGNDSASAAILGNVSNFSLGLSYRGGDGIDSIVGAMTGDVLSGSNVGINFSGDAGNDVMTFNASLDVDIAGFLPGQSAGALSVVLDGGDGNDVMNTIYHGELDGSLTMLALGRAGNDRLLGDVRLDTGSQVQGLAVVRLLGGDDNDDLTLTVRKQSPA